MQTLAAIISLLAFLVKTYNERKLRGEGRDLTLGKIAQEALNDLREIHKTRDAAFKRFDNGRKSGKLPDDIEYRD